MPGFGTEFGKYHTGAAEKTPGTFIWICLESQVGALGSQQLKDSCE